MVRESIVCGQGLLAQTKCNYFPASVNTTQLLNAVVDVLNCDARQEHVVWFTGGTIYYGRGARNLGYLHHLKICALHERDTWREVFKINKKIVFKFNPNDNCKHHRKHRQGCRGKKH